MHIDLSGKNAMVTGPTGSIGLAAERGVSISEMEVLFLRENRSSTLLGRFAGPEEVAAMSVYIASPQASATNGAALRMEGGIVESIA